MTNSLARARADLASGRAWKARDRLTGLLVHRQDDEVLDLLATVHHEMRNLPSAGALWFITGRDDDPARAAVAAWRERYGSDPERWRSLPAPVRAIGHSATLRSLREAAGQVPKVAGRGHSTEVTEAWWEPIVFGGGGIALLLWFVAMVGIGMVTVMRWIWS